MTDKSGKYRVQKLESADYAQWDQFVSTHSSATIFHTTTWAKIIETVFNRKFKILAIYKNDTLKGGLLHFPKNNLGIKSIPRVPITAYQGILLQPPESSEKTSSVTAKEHELTNLILDELIQQYNYIDLTLCPNVIDMRPYKWHKFSAEPIYTYTFKITDYDELSRQFNKSLRRKIKISLNKNPEIVVSEETDKFIKFVADSYQYHKLKPPIPSDKMDQLVRLCIENGIGKLFYLVIDKRLVAALFRLVDQHRVYGLFSGTDSNFRDQQFIKYLHALVLQQPDFQGKIFDFLGANTPDLEPFKRSFGGDLSQSFRVIYYKNPATRLLLKIREKQHLLARRKIGI